MFSTKSVKNQHVKNIHENSGKYACDACDKRFNFKQNLANHKALLHKKRDKSFLCQTCNKTFSQEISLKQHIKCIHEDVRNYQCEQCKKCFHRIRDLRNHVTGVHEKVKNYKCQTCQKSFLYSTNLAVHIKRVHEKSFKTKQSLKRFTKPFHIKNEEDEKAKPKCKICNALFSTDRDVLKQVIAKIEKVWNTRNAHGSILQ